MNEPIAREPAQTGRWLDRGVDGVDQSVLAVVRKGRWIVTVGSPDRGPDDLGEPREIEPQESIEIGAGPIAVALAALLATWVADDRGLPVWVDAE